MSGKVLEFKGERIYNEGIKKGEKTGEEKGTLNTLVELVHDDDLDFNVAAKRAEQKYGITREAFQEMVDNYQPDSVDLMQG